MKVLIAMSGGVDSSVAAALMKEAGYECIGVTMKLFANEDIGVSQQHTCCSLDDTEDARNVAFRLGIPHYVFHFGQEFCSEVIDRFVSAYEQGATPNPCIDCNRYIKFGALLERAAALGCSHVVTGHYARIAFDEERNRWLLLRGQNEAKDQSYVLCFLTQEQLAHILLPLGEFADKEEVRQMAEHCHLVNAHKHDSQDICFVQDGDYAGFIARYTGKNYPSGDFVDEQGNVLGSHRGLIRYTIGQRKGLGLSLPAPLYVKEKNLQDNTVVLAPEKNLYSRELTAEQFNWIFYDSPRPGQSIRVTAKPRYRAKEAPAEAVVLPDGRVQVIFDEPQRAITAGQTVVLYDGPYVVGGGIICGGSR